jgi:hypothetical protein
MTSAQLFDYLRRVLDEAAESRPAAPRPAGDFVGGLPAGTVAGMRLVAPDGTTHYLAVIEEAAFDRGGRDSCGHNTEGDVLSVAGLEAAMHGLAPDTPVVVGIINGPRFNAAYADQFVIAGAPALYICCHEEPRPWEGEPPTINEDGTATLSYRPPKPGNGGATDGKGA